MVLPLSPLVLETKYQCLWYCLISLQIVYTDTMADHDYVEGTVGCMQYATTI